MLMISVSRLRQLYTPARSRLGSYDVAGIGLTYAGCPIDTMVLARNHYISRGECIAAFSGLAEIDEMLG